jgi:hypothetical protein
MPQTLATMLTFTTYGTWLRGDKRGWVDHAQIFPPNPDLEAADRRRMNHPPYVFAHNQLYEVGDYIGTSLIERLNTSIFALAVGTWHIHIIIGPTCHSISEVAKCAKDAARYGLRPARPIWTDGYDKRFCFDERSALARIRYVERHNEAMAWPPRPWPFITPYPTAHTPHPTPI